MTAAQRIYMIRIYENLKEMYERGDESVIKTERGYKKIDENGKTIIEAWF